MRRLVPATIVAILALGVALPFLSTNRSIGANEEITEGGITYVGGMPSSQEKEKIKKMVAEDHEKRRHAEKYSAPDLETLFSVPYETDYIPPGMNMKEAKEYLEQQGETFHEVSLENSTPTGENMRDLESAAWAKVGR